MRILMTSALGLMLASGAALAQSNYTQRDNDDSYRYQNQSDRSSSGGYRHHWERSGDRDRDHSDKHYHHSDKHKHHARGASLYLKAGEREFRVDCGDDDSTRECVDAALVMFREMHGATSTSSSSTTPGASTPTTPGTSGGSSNSR